MKKAVTLLIVFTLIFGAVDSAMAFMYYSLDAPSTPGITSNSIIDIGHNSIGIWLGTANGASFSEDTAATWRTYMDPPLPSVQISALAASTYHDTTYMWTTTTHTDRIQGDTYPFGDGLIMTKNNGEDWDTVRTPEQCYGYGKLSYDLAMYRNHIYSACFYGGLIRSTNNGANWYPLYLSSSDSLDYSLKSYDLLTNRYFSVKVDTSLAPETISVWGGTAKGLNRFIFTHYDNPSPLVKQDTAIQYYYNLSDTLVPTQNLLPGNFVVGIGVHQIDTTTYIWAACRPGGGDSGQKYAIAYSADHGVTWITSLEVPAWDFAFNGDTTFVSFGDYGIPSYGYGLAILVRDSSGEYSDVQIVREMTDSTGMKKYFNSPFYCVDYYAGQIWAGGADGTVRSTNGGQDWTVYRSQIDPDNYYAYPSPFSPYTTERYGTTIHYKLDNPSNVTIKIFDFNLDLVKTVIDNQNRAGSQEYDIDIWDGKNDVGDYVANGIYFFNIKLSTGPSWWGKVAVVK
jgi:hypothetical protein